MRVCVLIYVMLKQFFFYITVAYTCVCALKNICLLIGVKKKLENNSSYFLLHQEFKIKKKINDS